MKTIADLNALIPTLVELLHNNDHEIGESYYEQDEDGWGRCDEPATNYLCYEDNGWLIEITYECCAESYNDPGDYWTPPSHDLKGAWGKVTEILGRICHIIKNSKKKIVQLEYTDDDDLNDLLTKICGKPPIAD